MNSLLLFSGGMDSTATLNILLNQNHNLTLLYIDYGQIVSRFEYDAALKISKHYKLELVMIKCDLIKPYTTGEIYGRNLFLISTALIYTSDKYNFIATGIHNDTFYLDCQNNYIEKTKALVRLSSNYEKELLCPLMGWTKQEIFDYCIKNNIPYELCRFCECGNIEPCLKCNSCQDYLKLNEYQKQKNKIE